MGYDMNMDGVEAWGAVPILSVGRHVVEVVDVKEEGEQFVLEMTAIVGAEAGGTIRDWVSVTPKTAGRIKMMLEAFGVTMPQGNFHFEPRALLGQVAAIIVRESTFNEKTRNKVYGYAPAHASEVPAASQPVPAGAFNGGSSAARIDEDIPF